MPSPSQLRLPPIQDEDLFEDFCRDLWAQIWKDPDAQRNGRKGQKQCGVDIFGIPEEQEDYEGVQAKAYKDPLTEKQIQDEVDQAKKFLPPLKKLTIATTAPRDANSQEYVRQINLQHRKAKLFKVTILGWEDIKRLKEFPQLIEHYFSIPTDTTIVKEAIAESESRVLSTLEQQGLRQEGMIARMDVLSAALPQERYHEDLNFVRNLVNTNRPTEALAFLEDFRQRFWHNADKAVRYRIIHYTATAQFALGKDKEAAPGFIEALRHNPDDDTALSFAALGHYLLGEKDKAQEYSQKALVLNACNSRANALLIQSRDPATAFEEVVASVPEPHRGLADVAYAFSRFAHQKGMMAEAEKWIREAIRNNTENWAEPHGFLGELLLEQATDAFVSPQYYQLTPIREALLRGAEKAFTDALAGGGTPDTLRGRAAWLCNRGGVRQLLGLTEEALPDLEEAARLAPDNAPILYRLALFLHETGNTTRALKIFRKLVLNPTAFDFKLTFASMLAAADESVEAQETLQGLLESNPPAEIAEIAKHFQVQIATQEGDFEEARRLSEEMLKDYPQSAAALVDAARIELTTGNREVAPELLRKASRFVSESRRQQDIQLIAITWEAAEDYHEAAGQYELLADTNADSQFTGRLVMCHYKAGNLERALTIAQYILSVYGPRAPYSEVAAAVYDEIGDLQSARKVLSDYLSVNPTDFSMQLRLGTIAFRMDDASGVDAFLTLPVNEETLTLDGAIRIIFLRQYRGMIEQALCLAWNTRRRFFAESQAHLFYVMVFMEIGQLQEEDWLHHDTVAVGTAVRIRDEYGGEQWHLIDEQADSRRLPEELSPSHPLAKKLLGKTVGHTVVLTESLYSKTKGTIEEIQSRYVRALQESMVSFEKLFPGVPGLWSVNLGLTNGNDTEPNLQPFFQMLDRQAEQTLAIEQHYREGKITIGMFASLTGMHPLAAWEHVRHRKQIGIRCSTGNLADMQVAQACISTDTVIIPDIISLCTLYNLECRDRLLATELRLGIAQSTLEIVERLLEDRKGHTTRGLMTAGKEDGQYIRQELSPEEMQRTVAFIEEFLGWIKANCTILPIIEALKKGRGYRTQFQDMMDPSFVDTILLASEPGHILYSDDERLRALAKGEAGIEGIWTQPLLTRAFDSGGITEQEYTNEIIKLVISGYYYTHINAKVLLAAAKQTNWQPITSFLALANLLSGNHSDEVSASAIVVEVVYALWTEPLSDYHRAVLLDSLLNSFVSGRNLLPSLQRLTLQIRRRFRLLPIQEEHVMRCIAIWMRGPVI